MLHAARSTAVKTLVVLDEVHHAGDGLSWGEATEEAFGFATRRLCLTGTPFRTKPDERIPFVRYEEDSFEGDGGGLGGSDEPAGVGLVSRADYTYGYREALADNVVRPVVFAAYTGTSRWRNSAGEDRKSTRLNSSHANISYAVFCLKKKKYKVECAAHVLSHESS